MKKVISISEIVAPIRVENDRYEVWASAEANYHEGKLEVQLDSFLRRSTDDEHLSPSWLPKTQMVIEYVDFEKGSPAPKEIFENWVKRVRRAVGKRSTAHKGT
ncbi:MAG: hypothetical protein WBL40_16820 [Terrimicrobiaceae bacterium]